MSFSYEEFLHLHLASDEDQDHGDELRQNLAVLGQLHAPATVYYVDANYSTANLFNGSATDRRHFDTIAGAIAAAAAGDTICVYPGNYAETLAITKTLRFVALGSPLGDPVLGSVILRGAGSAAPILSVDITDSTTGRVTFENFYMWNQYGTTNGTEITEAYLAEMVAPGTYGSARNLLEFINCNMRMMTYGEDNKWSYGFNVDGWQTLRLRGCDVLGSGFAGGNNNGGIRDMFYLRGTHPSTDPAKIRLRDVRVSQEWLGAGNSRTFNIDDVVGGSVETCTFNYPFLTLSEIGSNGTIDVTGLTNSSDFQDLRNVAQFDTAWL